MSRKYPRSNYSRSLKVHHFVLGLESGTTAQFIEQHRLALRSVTRARDVGVDGVEVCLELILSETEFDYSDIDVGSSIVHHNARDLFGPQVRPLRSARDVFRLLAQSPAEFVILSNADICGRESFYQWEYELHRDGVHSWTAHRKTILGGPRLVLTPLTGPTVKAVLPIRDRICL